EQVALYVDLDDVAEDDPELVDSICENARPSPLPRPAFSPHSMPAAPSWLLPTLPTGVTTLAAAWSRTYSCLLHCSPGLTFSG
ncbi:MCM7 isoform 7, partial [Pongo abelii]